MQEHPTNGMALRATMNIDRNAIMGYGFGYWCTEEQRLAMLAGPEYNIRANRDEYNLNLFAYQPKPNLNSAHPWSYFNTNAFGECHLTFLMRQPRQPDRGEELNVHLVFDQANVIVAGMPIRCLIVARRDIRQGEWLWYHPPHDGVYVKPDRPRTRR